MEHCRSLEYHHVEVMDSLQSKFQRLKALIETYTPNQDRQMVVIAAASELKEVMACIGESLEEADYDSVGPMVPQEERQALLMGFETGTHPCCNLFTMKLA